MKLIIQIPCLDEELTLPATLADLPRSLRDLPFPVQLRRRLEALGPTYVKLGQILSLREDILPRSITEELKHLLDRLPAVPCEGQSDDPGGDERLRHRGQVEHRLGRDRVTTTDVPHAEPACCDLPVADDRDGQARHVLLADMGLDERPEAVVQGCRQGRGVVHGPTVRRGPSESSSIRRGERSG